MWTFALKNRQMITNTSDLLLNLKPRISSQLRTTYIFKREFPPRLHTVGGPRKPLKGLNYIYELIKDTNVEKKPDINVILTQFVDGLGNAGDTVSVRPNHAYNHLLLPGLAVYATPENVAKYEKLDKSDIVQHSSATALMTVGSLTRRVIPIIMNKDTPWTLKSWHVRATLRKCGIIVPEKAITMPSHEISGPNLDYEDKLFYVSIKINNCEEVKVRCRIRHWSTDPSERLPYVPEYWKQPVFPMFDEDKKILDEIEKSASKSVNKET